MNENDPRVKRTRNLLVNAFTALLSEKGFAALSVKDVVERATVNRATFYAHFQDKYELLDRVVGDMFRERFASALPPTATFDAGNLRRLIEAALEAVADFYAHCRPEQRDVAQMMEQRVQRELYQHLLGWLRRPPRRSGAQVSPETAAVVASWAIFGAGVEYARGGDRAAGAAHADEVLDLVLGGLAAVVEVPPEAAPVLRGGRGPDVRQPAPRRVAR